MLHVILQTSTINLMQEVRMKYPVVVHQSKHGFDIHCPLLPGCHSQGDSLEEALANIKDAIHTYLEMISEEEKGSLYEVEVAV